MLRLGPSPRRTQATSSPWHVLRLETPHLTEAEQKANKEETAKAARKAGRHCRHGHNQPAPEQCASRAEAVGNPATENLEKVYGYAKAENARPISALERCKSD